jgi:hypothetical protein
MSVNELFPIVQTMPRLDKLRLMLFWAYELAKEEGAILLDENKVYPIWSPYNSFQAADTLLSVLRAEGRE